MKRIERDFITLFNCLWYQDFPVSEGDYTNTADWTIHIGLVVKTCAKLLGARAGFEQGGRTDAVIKFSDGKMLSNVEWEWSEAHRDDVGEIEKLLLNHEAAAFSTFISYSAEKNLAATIDKAASLWRRASRALIFFVVTFERSSGNREFLELQTYVFEHGSYRLYRSQPALPCDLFPSEYLEFEDGE